MFKMSVPIQILCLRFKMFFYIFWSLLYLFAGWDFSSHFLIPLRGVFLIPWDLIFYLWIWLPSWSVYLGGFERKHWVLWGNFLSVFSLSAFILQPCFAISSQVIYDFIIRKLVGSQFLELCLGYWWRTQLCLLNLVDKEEKSIQQL